MFCSAGTTVGFVSGRKINVFLQRGNNFRACRVQENHPSARPSVRAPVPPPSCCVGTNCVLEMAHLHTKMDAQMPWPNLRLPRRMWARWLWPRGFFNLGGSACSEPTFRITFVLACWLRPRAHFYNPRRLWSRRDNFFVPACWHWPRALFYNPRRLWSRRDNFLCQRVGFGHAPSFISSAGFGLAGEACFIL